MNEHLADRVAHARDQARNLMQSKEFAAAETILRRALGAAEMILGVDHEEACATREVLAGALQAQLKHDAAIPLLENLVARVAAAEG